MQPTWTRACLSEGCNTKRLQWRPWAYGFHVQHYQCLREDNDCHRTARACLKRLGGNLDCRGSRWQAHGNLCGAPRRPGRAPQFPVQEAALSVAQRERAPRRRSIKLPRQQAPSAAALQGDRLQRAIQLLSRPFSSKTQARASAPPAKRVLKMFSCCRQKPVSAAP